MENEELAKRLKELRQNRGWTKAELAEKINMSEQSVNNMEQGRRRIYANDLKAISDALGISMSDFFEIEKVLDLQQSKLVDIYQQLNKPSKKFLMRTAEDLLELEENQTTILIPIISEGRIPTTELDYYDQAAGLGPGQIVENPLKTKIKVASNQVPEEADYVIRVYGDSMEPKFSSGDKLYIKSTNVLKVGDVGVFSYQGEELVKELGVGKLISYNPEYQPIKVNTDELFIQGKVLGKV